jgi:hypothetical protein
MGITKLRKKIAKRVSEKQYTQCEDRLCWADSKRWVKKKVSENRFRVRCKCGKFIGYYLEKDADNGRP